MLFFYTHDSLGKMAKVLKCLGKMAFLAKVLGSLGKWHFWPRTWEVWEKLLFGQGLEKFGENGFFLPRSWKVWESHDKGKHYNLRNGD